MDGHKLASLSFVTYFVSFAQKFSQLSRTLVDRTRLDETLLLAWMCY